MELVIDSSGKWARIFSLQEGINNTAFASPIRASKSNVFDFGVLQSPI